MAEEILRQAVREEGIPHIRIASAGVMGLEGSEACLNARIVARHHGLDLSSHRARRLTAGMVHEADLILVMEKHHRKSVLSGWPSASGKTVLLKAFGPNAPGGEVADPVGRDLDFTETCFDELHAEIRRILPEIRKRAREKRALFSLLRG